MKHFLQHISDLILISKPCAHSARTAPFYFLVKNARNERPRIWSVPESGPNVVLPRKGKLSLKAKEIEHSESFIEARQKHSAVESAINALENHALDRCPDHGIIGFKRYVALAVLARNIQILGAKIQQKALKRLIRRKKAESQYRLAA